MPSFREDYYQHSPGSCQVSDIKRHLAAVVVYGPEAFEYKSLDRVELLLEIF